MKNINNTSVGAISKIHGLAFTIFFIIEQVLSEFLYPFLEENLHKALYLAISAVLAAFLYGFLFIVVKAIFDFSLRKKDTRMNIVGLWYHVHIPHHMGYEDYSQKRLSIGTTEISREFTDFTFVGNNIRCYYTDNKLDFRKENPTHWYTKATKLSDENDFDLIEIYEAKTKGNPTLTVESCPCCKTKFDSPVEITEAEKFRHGIHKFDIINENGSTIIKGTYSDCWPSLKTGELFFYRTEEERDQRILEFFENASRFNSKKI